MRRPSNAERFTLHRCVSAIGAPLLWGMLLLSGTASAQGDEFASDGSWRPPNPPLGCRHFVTQYNALTPKIYAANKAGNSKLRSDLTKQRTGLVNRYRECLKGNTVFEITGAQDVQGSNPTYPAPQMGGMAAQAGSLAGGTSGGSATPWTGTGRVPPVGSYSHEDVIITIRDYATHGKTYSATVILDRGPGKAYTHAYGTVNKAAKTFTISSVRDTNGKTIAVPRTRIQLN